MAIENGDASTPIVCIALVLLLVNAKMVTKNWWQHGKLHREDGPAVERINACNLYWFQGTYYLNNAECWARAVLQSRGTATCILEQDIDDFLRPILKKQFKQCF
jgi:hypothetical protein